MDGAFDMMHYGHMNAFRKGRALGTKLIVGVNSDETISICKGAHACVLLRRYNSPLRLVAGFHGWLQSMLTQGHENYGAFEAVEIS
jgi:cytidyltransferase-like protein